MNKLEEKFGKRRLLFPVVHCVSVKQVQDNVKLAMSCGAAGVFLIDQGGLNKYAVVETAIRINDHDVPGLVGVNILQYSNRLVIDVNKWELPMVWTDYSVPYATANWKAIYFGGAAFKYKAPVPPEKLGAVAKETAAMGVDVVTTSGNGTGQSPAVEKIKAMYDALEGHPLAIASGITPDNVDEFLPYTNAFLVATGIEKEFGYFDESRLKKLADKVNNYQVS